MTDAKVTAEELSELADITPRRVRQLVDAGVIPRPAARGEYELAASVRGLILHFKEQAGGHTAERSADRARRERAEADSAEMDAEKKRGTLMLAADARRWWADGFAKVRDVIARSGIKAEEKKRISEQLLKIKLEDDQ